MNTFDPSHRRFGVVAAAALWLSAATLPAAADDLGAGAAAAMPLPGATSAMPTEDREQKMKMDRMDLNKDGFLSRQEADAGMAKSWDQWDTNSDGKVDSTEYASNGKQMEAQSLKLGEKPDREERRELARPAEPASSGKKR